jgi:hypothetical protein
MSPVATCAHKQAVHQHGTHTAYVLDRCRCDECREANRVYAQGLRRTNLYGRQRLVDATPAREHLLELSRAGMGWKAAAAAAGVPFSTAGGILFGAHPDDPSHRDHRKPRQRITRDAEAKILAVRLQLADGANVDATGTRRRLQALVTLGWSVSALGRRLGKTSANMFTTLESEQVLEATRRRVAALYDELWDVPAPTSTRHERTSATRAKRYAAAHGWAPPLAWDDDEIDDPDARPQGLPEATPALSVTEQVVELLEIGYSVTEIPSRVGRRSLNAVLGCIRDRDLKAELTRRAS